MARVAVMLKCAPSGDRGGFGCAGQRCPPAGSRALAGVRGMMAQSRPFAIRFITVVM